MKKRQNLTNGTLREAWSCHLRLKIHNITGKISFKCCKLTFLGVGTKLFSNLLKYKQNTKEF